MKKLIFGALFIITAMIMTGCGPYGTRAFHVPQLDEKGDFQANAYFSAPMAQSPRCSLN